MGANELYEAPRCCRDASIQKSFSFQEFQKGLSQYAPSVLSTYSDDSDYETPRIPEGVAIVKGEEMNANFGGLRFVLIGDVSELPVLDMKIKPF